jgi:hypothetical protein
VVQASQYRSIRACSASTRRADHAYNQEAAIAQWQAGWSRLQMAYLSVSYNEVRMAMRDVDA